MAETTYLLEISPNGRSKCKGPCKQAIAKGELRFAATAPLGASRAFPVKACRHVFCITDRVWRNVLAKLGNIQEISGYADLTDEDKETVQEACAEAMATAERGKAEKERAKQEKAAAKELAKQAKAEELKLAKREKTEEKARRKAVVAKTAEKRRREEEEEEVEGEEFDEAEDGLEVEVPPVEAGADAGAEVLAGEAPEEEASPKKGKAKAKLKTKAAPKRDKVASPEGEPAPSKKTKHGAAGKAAAKKSASKGKAKE